MAVQRSVTVCVPVLDGARWLPALIDALLAQQTPHRVEVLVIDSGSTDGSVGLARARGTRVVEIAPEEFGHGRTRNRAVELSGTELVAFLTQDATPAGSGWLSALVAPFDDERVGAAYGPQLPRPDADSRTGRVLAESYLGPDRLVSDADVPHPVFSDVNSCLRRAAWEGTPFRDVPYAEDTLLERDLLAAGWLVAYAREAAVVHSNHYRLGQHWGRMLDEVAAHPRRAPLPWRSVAKNLLVDCRSDLRWARVTGTSAGATTRGLVGEVQRATAAVLHARAPRAFDAAYRRWSLERGSARGRAPQH